MRIITDTGQESPQQPILQNLNAVCFLITRGLVLRFDCGSGENGQEFVATRLVLLDMNYHSIKAAIISANALADDELTRTADDFVAL